jgi:CSLREA domain-containing protein
MRRLPSSWTTTLTKLGFKRKTKKRSQMKHGRRSQLEPLEARHMLAVLTVNSTADNTTVDAFTTLREAIATANSDSAADTIVFDPAVFNTPKTITLASQLTISEDLTIEGPGADLLSISGNNASRVFVLNSGDEALIQDVTITEGYVSDTNGGAIWSEGDLTLQRVVVSNSTANRTTGNVG